MDSFSRYSELCLQRIQGSITLEQFQSTINSNLDNEQLKILSTVVNNLLSTIRDESAVATLLNSIDNSQFGDVLTLTLPLNPPTSLAKPDLRHTSHTSSFKSAKTRLKSQTTRVLLKDSFLPLISLDIPHSSVLSMSGAELIQYIKPFLSFYRISPLRIACSLCSLVSESPMNRSFYDSLVRALEFLSLSAKHYDGLVGFLFTLEGNAKYVIAAHLIQSKLIDLDCLYPYLKDTSFLESKLSEFSSVRFPNPKSDDGFFIIPYQFVSIDLDGVGLVEIVSNLFKLGCEDEAIYFLKVINSLNICNPMAITKLRENFINFQIIPFFAELFSNEMTDNIEQLYHVFIKRINIIHFYIGVTNSTSLLNSLVKALSCFFTHFGNGSPQFSELLFVFSNILIPSLLFVDPSKPQFQREVSDSILGLWQSFEFPIKIDLLKQSSSFISSHSFLVKVSKFYQTLSFKVSKKLNSDIHLDSTRSVGQSIQFCCVVNPSLCFPFLLSKIINIPDLLTPLSKLFRDLMLPIFFGECLVISILQYLTGDPLSDPHIESNNVLIKDHSRLGVLNFKPFVEFLSIILRRFSVLTPHDIITSFILPKVISGDYLTLTLLREIISQLSLIESPFINQVDISPIQHVYGFSLRDKSIREFLLTDASKNKPTDDSLRNLADCIQGILSVTLLITLAQALSVSQEGCSVFGLDLNGEPDWNSIRIVFSNPSFNCCFVDGMLGVKDLINDVLLQLLDYLAIYGDAESTWNSLPSIATLIKDFNLPLAVSCQFFIHYLDYRALSPKSRVSELNPISEVIAERTLSFSSQLKDLYASLPNYRGLSSWISSDFFELLQILRLDDIYYHAYPFDHIQGSTTVPSRVKHKVKEMQTKVLASRNNVSLFVKDKITQWFRPQNPDTFDDQLFEQFIFEVILPKIKCSPQDAAMCGEFLRLLLRIEVPNLFFFDILNTLTRHLSILATYTDNETRRFGLFYKSLFQNLEIPNVVDTNCSLRLKSRDDIFTLNNRISENTTRELLSWLHLSKTNPSRCLQFLNEVVYILPCSTSQIDNIAKIVFKYTTDDSPDKVLARSFIDKVQKLDRKRRISGPEPGKKSRT
ncbi:hypothetical protein P9112_012160 [Eukaryota sp. TZLM1-RC]